MTAAIACEGWVVGWCVLVAAFDWPVLLLGRRDGGRLIVVVAAADAASVEEGCGGRNGGELLSGRRDEN